MLRLTFAALLSFAALAPAAPVPKGMKKQPPSLDGRWQWETQESDGKVSPASTTDYTLWVVDGDTMTLTRQKNGQKDEVPCGFVGDLADDGQRKFEYKVTSNGYHRRGVCELVDADTLKVAWSPHDKPGVKNGLVYTFKRMPAGK
jgi:uncharacterized protein (TIGR03067 family)